VLCAHLTHLIVAYILIVYPVGIATHYFCLAIGGCTLGRSACSYINNAGKGQLTMD